MTDFLSCSGVVLVVLTADDNVLARTYMQCLAKRHEDYDTDTVRAVNKYFKSQVAAELAFRCGRTAAMSADMRRLQLVHYNMNDRVISAPDSVNTGHPYACSLSGPMYPADCEFLVKIIAWLERSRPDGVAPAWATGQDAPMQRAVASTN